MFFRITDANAFKTALKNYQPTSSTETLKFVYEIASRKKQAGPGAKIARIPNAQHQIAFTRMGLNFLGQREATGDNRFDRFAMRDDRERLGDQAKWDSEFDKPNPDPINGSVNSDAGALHGVFSVVGSGESAQRYSDPLTKVLPDEKTCVAACDAIKKTFGSSMNVVNTLEGRARPGDQEGHEHFGYEDGISQPALRFVHVNLNQVHYFNLYPRSGVTQPRPGQIQVNPGVVVLGYKGDPVVDDPYAKQPRPAWAKDGTMMVFRKLQQFVPEFDAYIYEAGKRWPEFAPGGQSAGLTDDEGAELFGARMIGRFKSVRCSGIGFEDGWLIIVCRALLSPNVHSETTPSSLLIKTATMTSTTTSAIAQKFLPMS